MRDTRLYKRIPCDGTGHILVGEEELPVSAINLSKGGVCMRLAESEWQRLSLDEEDSVVGRLIVDGDEFNFKARICWSNTADDKVFFGVEFKDYDKHILDSVLERLSVDDPPEMQPFNI